MGARARQELILDGRVTLVLITSTNISKFSSRATIAPLIVLVISLLFPSAAEAQVSIEDLASATVDGELTGASSDKLGGMYVEDVVSVYWDAPSSGGSNTDRGPISSPAAQSCDFDGDGSLDLAVGAPGNDTVYIFYGDDANPNLGARSLAAAADSDVKITGPNNSSFGIELGAADVNNDGHCDLLVGAPDVGNTGAVFLYLGDDRGGSSGFFPVGPATVDGSANYSVRVVGDSEGSGDSVAFTVATGDVSGDGIADFVVGAFFMDRDTPTDEQDAGAVAVYFGKSTATHANTSNVNLTMGGVTSGGNSFDGYNVRYFGEEGYTPGIFKFDGDTENLGSAIACVDFNGDGVDDVVMGAPSPELNYSSTGNNDTGSIYVVFGGGGASGNGTVNLGSGSVILGDTASYHLRFNGVENWAHLGAAIAGGDITGDGVDDIAVAAPYAWRGFSAGDQSGSVYIIPGSTGYQGMSRVNTNVDLIDIGDGYSVRIDGAAVGDELRSVAIGDINGDGQADLLLGAPRADPSSRTDAGATYELTGPLSGNAVISLSGATHDRETYGASAGDRLGTALAIIAAPCGGSPRRLLSAPYASSSAGIVYQIQSDLGPVTCGSFCSDKADGTPCSDGDTCTVGDQCIGGVCIGAPPSMSDATCDGADDDCDAEFDEDYAVIPSCGIGYCAANSTPSSCVSGNETDCQPASPLSATDTTCDGVDDDCDNSEDEDYVSSSTCGIGYCNTTNTPSSCSAGVETSCQPGTPLSATDATCDGVDDDCDGSVDEDYVLVASCGVGYCIAGSTPSSCSAGVETDCSPGTPLSETDLTCDGVDDNCNGSEDEGYLSDASCGQGYCLANNTPSACTSGVETGCQAGSPLSADDATCDLVDDNCDGAADEDYVVVPSCGTGYCAAQSTPSSCSAGVETSCAPGDPLSLDDATCDGVDDNCDGSNDENYAVVASCGTGYCADQSTASSCSAGVEVDCAPGAPLSNDDATCDMVDDNCDGLADEDSTCFETDLLVSAAGADTNAEASPLGKEAEVTVFRAHLKSQSAPLQMQSIRFTMTGLEGLRTSNGELTAQLYSDPNGDGSIADDGVLIATLVNVEPDSGALVFPDVNFSMEIFEERDLVVTMISTGKASGSGCQTTGGSTSAFAFFLLALVWGRPRRGQKRGLRRRIGVYVLLVSSLFLTLSACGRKGFAPRFEGQLHLEPTTDLQVTSELWPDIAVQGASIDGSPFLITEGE